MQPKHTPAPWTVEPGPEVGPFPTLAIYGGSCIALVYGNGKLTSGANARLISAAPDLYAAAREINTLLRSLSVNVECATKELANEFYEAEARLRAAIAKADGDGP